MATGGDNCGGGTKRVREREKEEHVDCVYKKTSTKQLENCNKSTGSRSNKPAQSGQ